LLAAARQKKRDTWKPDEWQPVTDEDKVIDRFVRLRKANDPDALKLLRPLPPEDQPINDADFESVAANYFLRSPQLRIIDVWKGEPGSDGKPRPAPGRYILVTKGSVSTPVLRIRNAGGGDSPSQMHMSHPDLVVEVKDGVIRPLRTEMHRAP
jgi:hypothetical protein